MLYYWEVRKKHHFDPIIFFSTVALVIGGFLMFLSASLGAIARKGGDFSELAGSQFFVGIVGGFIALYITSHIPYRFWKRFSFHFFAFAILLTLLVFAPGIGLELNGARRWLDFGITTFQPAELLKIGYVLYLATYLSTRRSKHQGWFARTAPFAIITGIVAGLLLLQPDTGTFIVIAAAGGAMYFASGAKWRDIGVLALVGVIALSGIVYTRPYALDRIKTYLHPSVDPLGAGFQVQKSLIAVGSGQLFGRGFGQSIQKFTTLPEPTSDSIFAVYAEEFGFFGAVVLILAFLLFTLRSLSVAAHAPDRFSGLAALGIAILVLVQSFLNIGSMLAVFPLTGLPLIFISHGGTALFAALASVGILLNISRFARA